MINTAPEQNKRSIFFIIPAFNEGSVIQLTLEPILKAGYSIVVVDDGSTDNTWKMITKLPIYSLRHPVNLGQGAALQTGMTFALSHNAKIIVHFDADGQHRLADLNKMLDAVIIDQADIILGSRFLTREDRKNIPLSRRVLLRFAIMLNAAMTGVWLTDAHNGLRVLNRKAAENIFFHENGFAHATEIINLIRCLKLRYVEMPTRINYSKYSLAKGQSAWNAINIFIDLLLRRFFK